MPDSNDFHHSFSLVNELLKNYLQVSNQNSVDSNGFNFNSITRVIPSIKSEEVNRAYAKLSTASYTCFEGEIPAQSIPQHQQNGENSVSTLQDYVHSILSKNEHRVTTSSITTLSSPTKTLTDSVCGKVGASSHLETSVNNNGSSEELGSNMVIHVCDEAKNLKQDFTCPRDLLIREMKYFAEYLSIESQRLEEVDISVHCDIHIFDWLMRYVKRNTHLIKQTDIPQLEASNVVSILISSDFLRMDSLVSECVTFCHENMSVILSTPCNMNCINDKLTGRISTCFTHNELEDVKDRKDKFKSKLYCKKIEQLFDETRHNADSPGNACSLFKCLICQRVMTAEQNFKLPCANSKLTVDGVGTLSYRHLADPGWDINSYIMSLHEELHRWGAVYWRLWGTVNHLLCVRCQQTFQLCEFGHCRYHLERAQYAQLLDAKRADEPVGTYLCCNQHVLRFDPTGLNRGCAVKDHVVVMQDLKQRQLIDDLHLHKHMVRVAFQENAESCGDLNIFAAEEAKCFIKDTTVTPADIYQSGGFVLTPKSSNVSLTSDQFNGCLTSARGGVKNFRRVRNVGSGEDEGEEDLRTTPIKSLGTNNLSAKLLALPKSYTASASNAGAESVKSVNVQNKKTKEKVQLPKDVTAYRKCPSKQRWDLNRSVRFNQDLQREEDRRRLSQLSGYLSRRKREKADGQRASSSKQKETKELHGGIFTKLEVAFMNSLKSQSASRDQRGAASGGNRDLKSKMKAR